MDVSRVAVGTELHDLDTKAVLFAATMPSNGCGAYSDRGCFYAEAMDDGKKCPPGCIEVIWMRETQYLTELMLGETRQP